MPTLYRLLHYVGPQEWIDRTLANSINGKKELPSGATISAISIESLALFREGERVGAKIFVNEKSFFTEVTEKQSK